MNLISRTSIMALMASVALFMGSKAGIKQDVVITFKILGSRLSKISRDSEQGKISWKREEKDKRKLLAKVINKIEQGKLPKSVVNLPIPAYVPNSKGKADFHQNATLLWHATDIKDYGLVKKLVELGASADIPENADGETPLMLASANGSELIVTELLKTTKNVNTADSDGKTALWNAAVRSNLQIVRQLIAAGADLTINEDGETILDFMLENYTSDNYPHYRFKSDEEIIRLLEQIQPTVQSVKGAVRSLTADLNKIIQVRHRKEDTIERLEAFVLSIEQGKTPRDTINQYLNLFGIREHDNDNSTPFIETIKSNSLDLTKKMILLGANPELPTKTYRWTPLMFACESNNPSLVAELLKVTNNIDQVNYSGSTALMTTCSKNIGTNASTIVKLLIDAGANVNAQNTHQGATPLMAVRWTMKWRTTKELQEDLLKIISLLLEAGADVSQKNKMGETVLDQIYEGIKTNWLKPTENTKKVIQLLEQAQAKQKKP